MGQRKIGRGIHGTGKNKADTVFGKMIEAGAAAYRRERDLPKLLALWPHQLADKSEIGSAGILEMLRSALRTERRRAIANHWSYDLNRHLALLSAYRAEWDRLKRLSRKP